MSKAEELANTLGYGIDPLNRAEYTANEVRDAFIEGYNQAEKVLGLTWEDIEYTRTDAFIDKACEWLSNHVNDYIINDKYILPNGKMSRDWLKIKSDMFDDFRKYMKRE